MTVSYAEVPSVERIAERLGVASTDLEFRGMYEAALRSQSAVCSVDPYDEGLAEGLIRRVANLWASRVHTMGLLDTGTDFGVQRVPVYDPQVEALEAHRRDIPVA